MRSGIARIVKGCHSFTTLRFIRKRNDWAKSAFAFPAAAGTHLPTPEGWKDVDLGVK